MVYSDWPPPPEDLPTIYNLKQSFDQVILKTERVRKETKNKSIMLRVTLNYLDQKFLCKNKKKEKGTVEATME